MEIYLCIITTVLVVTQIIRVTQNAIQLHITNGKIKKTLDWIEHNDISETDFQTQREVFRLLKERLESKENEVL